MSASAATHALVAPPPDATPIRKYQAITLRAAIRIYDATGMKANRAYTPKNMLATATMLTGKEFKRGQYAEAIAALTEFINSPTVV